MKIILPLSSAGSGNKLNMYLNPRIHGSIPMEKNSTREGGGEDHEVAVPISSKAQTVTDPLGFC